MKIKKNESDFIVIKLERGDELVSSLQDVARENNITAGIIAGIGAVENPTLGYFNIETQAYQQREFGGDFELLTLQGNLSVNQEGEPVVHLHASIGDADYKVYGGHLFQATIAVTGELFLRKLDMTLIRELDIFGLSLLNLK